MYYQRKLIQFNELVIDNHDMISVDDPSVSFKNDSQNLPFGNGAYVPYLYTTSFVEPQTLNTTLTFYIDKIPCEHRHNYINFIKTELLKTGKLWCIDNGVIEWAHASATSFGESMELDESKITIVVDFQLTEGVWHKANLYTTFLLPYDHCDFLDCYEFEDKQSSCCANDDCLGAPKVIKIDCNCSCNCITKEMALCGHMKEIDVFYKECEDKFRIKEDCDLAKTFFGYHMYKSISNSNACSEVIAGRIYNNGELPTSDYRIIIEGDLLNPEIEINGVINILKVEICGRVIVDGSGNVYTENEDGCQTLLDVETLKVPTIRDSNGNVLKKHKRGFVFNPRYNSVIIRTGKSGIATAYFDLEEITL